MGTVKEVNIFAIAQNGQEAIVVTTRKYPEPISGNSIDSV